MAVELYDHQKKAIDELSNGKILLGGVGSGKTLTSLAYYRKHEAPRDIFVITTAKKRDSLDWQREASLLAIGSEKSEIAGALVVDSWNNIKKYVDTKDAFFIFDEQRVVGTGAWTKAFWKITKQNRWIMLSATPGDTWQDYTAIFVANKFFRNQTQYKDQHMVFNYYGGYPKLERYLNEEKLERLRKQVLVEMPYVGHTRRHIHQVPVTYDNKEFKKIMKTRQDPETGEPFMNAAALVYALRKSGNQHQSRKDELIKIADKAKRVVVFYNHDYELETLRTLSDRYTIAEWNGHKHEEVPEGESWLYLVQYTAGSEGWNCITTDTIVFYSLTYSYKQYEQAQGRIDRLNTPYTDLHYFVLRSPSPIDRAVWDALRNKKNFNERAFVDQKAK